MFWIQGSWGDACWEFKCGRRVQRVMRGHSYYVIWWGASSISMRKVSIGVSPISLKKKRCSKHLSPMERSAGNRSNSLANLFRNRTKNIYMLMVWINGEIRLHFLFLFFYTSPYIFLSFWLRSAAGCRLRRTLHAPPFCFSILVIKHWQHFILKQSKVNVMPRCAYTHGSWGLVLQGWSESRWGRKIKDIVLFPTYFSNILSQAECLALVPQGSILGPVPFSPHTLPLCYILNGFLRISRFINLK